MFSLRKLISMLSISLIMILSKDDYCLAMERLTRPQVDATLKEMDSRRQASQTVESAFGFAMKALEATLENNYLFTSAELYQRLGDTEEFSQNCVYDRATIDLKNLPVVDAGLARLKQLKAWVQTNIKSDPN